MLHTIWKSIRKPSSYRDMTVMKLWKAILMFLIFFLIVMALQGWMFLTGANRFAAFMEQDFAGKMPNFTFNGKQLDAEQSQPVTLYAERGYVIIVDTLSDPPSHSLSQVMDGMVFGKTNMYVVERGTEHALSYSQVAPIAGTAGTLTKDDLVKISPYLKPIIYSMLALWSVAFLLWKFIAITLVSFLVMFIASIRKVRLTYRQAWLVAGFALIPATLINLLHVFVPSGYISLAYWVALLTYIFHGVGSFREGAQ